MWRYRMKVYATVKKKNGNIRKGRGFSREELKKAGIDPKTALKLGISVDLRRKTLHEKNIDLLKQFLTSMKKTKRKEGFSK